MIAILSSTCAAKEKDENTKPSCAENACMFCDFSHAPSLGDVPFFSVQPQMSVQLSFLDLDRVSYDVPFDPPSFLFLCVLSYALSNKI